MTIENVSKICDVESEVGLLRNKGVDFFYEYIESKNDLGRIPGLIRNTTSSNPLVWVTCAGGWTRSLSVAKSLLNSNLCRLSKFNYKSGFDLEARGCSYPREYELLLRENRIYNSKDSYPLDMLILCVDEHGYDLNGYNKVMKILARNTEPAKNCDLKVLLLGGNERNY